ncbi:MAG: SH3 domain-containing protein [Peptostreptococcus sp.]|uniref:SH3 domain-containing protein n=1 Tax=Peptostreptococcus sp. TaxID=1262 RepID=UPI002FC8ACA1
MKWNDNDFDKPKVFDSKDLSQDTQEIKLDKLRESIEDEDYTDEFKAYEKYVKKEKRKRKKIFIILTIVMVILIAAVSFVAVRYLSRISNLESDAQKYLEQGQYEQAADIYKMLYDETGEAEYMQNYKYISKNVENRELLKEADNSIKQHDYEGAIEVLLTMSTNEDKIVDQISERQDLAAKKWLEEIEECYNSGKSGYCTAEINKFVNLLPDNIKGVTLREKIIKKESEEEAKGIKNDSEQGQADLDKLNSRLNRKMYEKSKAIVGTEQYVTVENANVRENPSRDSKVSGTIHKGESVYIEDTKVESSNSIWCKITYYSSDRLYTSGWISYNIINGSENQSSSIDQ